MTGPEEGGLPSAEELFSQGAEISSAELSAAVLEQLGSDRPGPFGSHAYRRAWGDHQRRIRAGYPDVGGLADGLGLR
jgi:hypothetical protein